MRYPDDYTLEADDFGPAFTDDGPLSYLAALSDGTVRLEVIEYLDFHRERLGEAGEVLFDDYHFLTNEAERALAEHMGAELGVQVDADTSTDHAHVVLSVEVGTLPMTYREALEAAWPAYAGIANMTDPGAFGVPYVFNDVLEHVTLTTDAERL